MMKVKLYGLFLFLISVFTMGIVHASTLPLLGKVIYLDSGHGGKDPGAIVGDLHEADINLQITLKLQKTLEKEGAQVFLTRYGDYDLAVKNAQNRKRSDLSRRANIINRSGADLYFSIHLNADTSATWKGAQAFYVDANPENEQVAKTLQEVFAKNLNTKRQYKKIYDQYMYKRIEVPGALLEVGFITNPNERYLLKTEKYQEKIAKTITEGVIHYFKLR